MSKKLLSTLLTPETGRHKGLINLELLVFAYIIFTSLFVAAYYNRLEDPVGMIVGRIAVVLLTIALWQLYRRFPSRLTFFLRNATHLWLLAYWYPDTYELNRLRPNLDHLFAQTEQWMFGFQPALLFHQLLPSPFWSEAFNFGYYAYFPMILLVVSYYFFTAYSYFERITFILMGAFLLYYVIYIILPVVGPQYYFLAIGVEQAQQGNFPMVHNYFNTCRDIMPAPGYSDGLFYQLVTATQETGERPTAAFPSSHIGVSTILLLLAYRLKRKLCYALIPIYLLLCGATVYIQAHYVIDGIAGLITGILSYYLCKSIASRTIPLYKA